MIEYKEWFNSPFTQQLLEEIENYRDKAIYSDVEEPKIQLGKIKAADTIIKALLKKREIE